MIALKDENRYEDGVQAAAPFGGIPIHDVAAVLHFAVARRGGSQALFGWRWVCEQSVGCELDPRGLKA